MYRVLSFFFSLNLISYTLSICMYVTVTVMTLFAIDVFLSDRWRRARESISIRTIFVFVTSALSSRATDNASAKMLHKIYAAYLHLWRNGRDRDVCYIPRAAFREDKSYELRINQCNRERYYVARRKNVTSIFCQTCTQCVFFCQIYRYDKQLTRRLE